MVYLNAKLIIDSNMKCLNDFVLNLYKHVENGIYKK